MREKVCESFIGFFELNEGVYGEAIGGKIEKAIADWYLNPLDQGGRLMMEQALCQDSIKVVQLFCKKYPKAVYSHCCSHALNLAIVNSCSCI